MASRIDTPDTDADQEIQEILDLHHSIGFTVIAGAGSGKTTSLVKAMAHITKTRGATLLAKTQRVACITYTDVAAKEIHADLGEDPLALVSTIHSFLWLLIKPFQQDISAWVSSTLDEKIAEMLAKQQNYSPGVKPATKEKNAAELDKWRRQKTAVDKVLHWQYGVGSDYAAGVLGHSDILKMVPNMILTRELLARLVASQFPFVFVDESQDTFPDVVKCLKHVWSLSEGQMCLGFFGDPMQQIYPAGVGKIPLEPGWRNVEKPENFRSSRRVLACVNAVRFEDDAIEQISGLGDIQPEGDAFFFVLPADEERSENLEMVRSWLDGQSQAGNWTRSAHEGGSKVLMIVHRMAARRLGFDGLFAAFNDSGTSTFDDAFKEGTAWPLTPFRDVIYPLCVVEDPDSPSVLATLRRYSPLLTDLSQPKQLRVQLTSCRQAVTRLKELVYFEPDVPIGQLLTFAACNGLVDLDPRMAAYLEPDGQHRDVVIGERVRQVLDAMMRCPFSELHGYYTYVNEESPYSTQHGTKGAEFDRVVVVLDDEEGSYPLYSYDKLLGLKALSDNDIRNQKEGKDSVIERTRRLFYVCVSRAKKSLAIAFFAADPEKAAESLRQSTLGPHVQILSIADL